MRIRYNVLWVEDEDSWFESTEELIKDFLIDLGFILQLHRCKSVEEVKHLAINGLREFDLLLVDFNLSGSDSGENVIHFFRNSEILTEVLFYSSAVENVRDSLKDHGLEGVYTADRRDIISKFEQLVYTTLKKIQEVNTMRGLIMAETSDLDELMLEITKSIIESDISENISQYIEAEIINTTSKLSSKANSDIKLLEKINDTRLFTSFHKAKTINKLNKLKTIGIDKFFEEYNKDILSTRNVFAHVTEEIEDGIRILVSHATGNKVVFDERSCIKIRKDLIKYRNTLENIKDILAKDFANSQVAKSSDLFPN